jgi:hypothetical protein
MTVAIVGSRIKAQETIHGAASNSSAHFELCCGREHIEAGEKKVGVFYKAAAGIFRGKVMQLNNKEIVIENDSKQMVSIRRSHQTKFLKNNKPISPSDIDLETPVTIDARETSSVNLLALEVSVDSPPMTTGDVDGPEQRQSNVSLGVRSFAPKTIDTKRIAGGEEPPGR